MCHGRIAPKSSSEFVVTSVGHGVFLQLVILCSLLGDGLASVWYVQQEASSLKPDRARWGTCC
ncbi:rCG20613, isoform CRA_b [Rattus norvegicus]|uniref:RCG20613, isoform CRA_b n=1 Tax=Rattus norvegicus TaxID=10116 RepID=A6JDK4_RAT|nr:rCG20613, isoform CRA_b [Rattus norvegicus]